MSRSGPQAAPARTAARGRRATAGTEHGLGAVLGTWLAQLLLVLAGVAALVALWELRDLQHVRGRQRHPTALYRRAPAPKGRRRRLAQALQLYRGHQHP